MPDLTLVDEGECSPLLAGICWGAWCWPGSCPLLVCDLPYLRLSRSTERSRLLHLYTNYSERRAFLFNLNKSRAFLTERKMNG